MRVFLDANILFSAARTDGTVRQILTDLRRRRFQLVASPMVVQEAARNLTKKSPESLDQLKILLETVEVSESRSDRELGAYGIDDKDDHVMRSALASQCQYLLTGDKAHFGHLFETQVEGIEVHSPPSIIPRLLL